MNRRSASAACLAAFLVAAAPAHALQDPRFRSPYAAEREAALAEASAGTDGGRAVFRVLISDSEARVRGLGARGLGGSGGPEDAARLREIAVSDPDPEVRRAAMDALVRLRSRGLLAPESLGDMPASAATLRERALFAFAAGHFADIIAEGGVAGVSLSAFRRFRPLRELGAAAAPALLRVLREGSADVRVLALVALGRSGLPGSPFGGPEGLTPEGRALLGDRDERLPAALLFGAACAGEASIPFLREVAAFALAPNPERAVDTAAFLLLNIPEHVREAIRGDLVAVGRALLLETGERLRSAGAWMLAVHRLPELYDPGVEAFVRFRAAERRFSAFRMLAGLGATAAAHPDGGRAEAFRRLLREESDHPDPVIRGFCRAQLRGENGGDSGAGDHELVAAILAVLGREYDETSDPEGLSKQAAAEALAALGAGSARPAIEALLRHPSESVAMMAARALLRLGDPASVPALRQAGVDLDEFAASEATVSRLHLGDRTAAADLLGFLDTGNAVIARRVAAEVSGVLGEPVSVDPVAGRPALLRRIAELRARLAVPR